MHVPGEPELSPDALVTECALGRLSRASSSVRTAPADLLLPLANSPDGGSGHVAGCMVRDKLSTLQKGLVHCG